jgi:hypothetical protein
MHPSCNIPAVTTTTPTTTTNSSISDTNRAASPLRTQLLNSHHISRPKLAVLAALLVIGSSCPHTNINTMKLASAFGSFVTKRSFPATCRSYSSGGAFRSTLMMKAKTGQAEVVLVGCGAPNRGMGWYHAVQMLEGRCVFQQRKTTGRISILAFFACR